MQGRGGRAESDQPAGLRPGADSGEGAGWVWSGVKVRGLQDGTRAGIWGSVAWAVGSVIWSSVSVLEGSSFVMFNPWTRRQKFWVGNRKWARDRSAESESLGARECGFGDKG